MSHKFFFIILFLAVSFYALTQSTDKNNLKYGKYNVGFQTIRLKGKNEYPLLISLWYPATAGGAKICLRDYIIAGALTTDIADTVSIHQFRRVLELPFLFHLDKIPDADFEKLLSTQFKACKDASIQKQKFPLLIVQATSDNYIEMFEFLASHGFILAGITTSWKDEQNDTLLYVNATNILEELLNFMVKQSYVDTSRIAGFGHGGGIQPAFYLAMRTLRIKLLVNLDGGVFGPRSKTTLSPDYAPSRLKIPMLHIITQSQRKEDNEIEFNALSNPRYRLIVNSDSVRHHDFTTWGRVVAVELQKRGDAAYLIGHVFSNVQYLILYFLKNNRLDSSIVDRNLFQYEKF